MSTNFLSLQCKLDNFVSESSNNNSLIQEFEEFESDVYSGKLFNQNLIKSSNKHSPTVFTNESSIDIKDDCLNKVSVTEILF